MTEMLELRCDPQDAAGLRKEIARRDKIIGSLIHQVEQNLNSMSSSYGLLQNTFLLEEQVRQRTDELKKSVETIEAFMANASVGILFVNGGTVTRYNARFGQLFGFKENEAIGQRASMLFGSKSDYDRVNSLATPLFSAGQPFNAEGYMRRQDGTRLWINLIGYACSAESTERSTIWLLEDRTAFKQADEALRRSHEELEARIADRTAELSQQLHFQKQLIEAIPGPIFYKDAEGRYLGCNSAFETFIGVSAEQLIGKVPQDIAPGLLAAQYREADLKLLGRGGVQIFESQLRNASGELRDVMFHKACFTQPDGTIGGLVGVILDISERKSMENGLRQAAKVFESSAEGVIISDPDGAIVACNRAFTEITGYSESEVIGRNPRFLQSGRHSKGFFQEMWGTIARDGHWQGEIWNRRKNGEIFPCWDSISIVRNKAGEISNYVATFSDISQQKKNEERIHLLAFTDPLTNLPNRRLLLDRLQHALATSKRNQWLAALFFIDLDDFKYLNDTRGHDIGDHLLQLVAERLADCVQDGDTVARLGGDEFVVMLEGLSDDPIEASGEAEAVGRKILEKLNEPYVLDGLVQRSTPSIGVTLFGDQQSSVDELLKQADLAMYQAKSSGRNALRFFDPEMQSALALRVAMEADLRQGLRENQYLLHYQAQVDRSGHVLGAEALLRWQHPVRGMIPPGEFIPLAEENGQILPIGSWVLDTACAQLSAWAKRPDSAHLTLAINVSALQFYQPGFVEQVISAIEYHHIAADKLKLEITESLLLEDVEQMISKMEALKARGVGFSLDDFGTGYSSLSYLKRLPLDQLKIDQSFVRDVMVDPNNASIAKTIVALAHSLGLDVIAEGVETEEQLLFLARNNCRIYQGYLFSRPLPLEQFEQFRQQPAKI